MAATIKDDVDPSVSTGAVKFDSSPQKLVSIPDSATTAEGFPVSTGAVKMPKVQEVVADWHGQAAIMNVPTPGPVTMTVSWLPETKVVGPAKEAKSADPSPVAETKKK